MWANPCHACSELYKRKRKCQAYSKKAACDDDEECKFEEGSCLAKSDMEVAEIKRKAQEKCEKFDKKADCDDKTCSWDDKEKKCN